MPLSPAHLQLLHDDILVHPVYGALPHTGDNAFRIADGYNTRAVPDFWVWRTSLSEKEVYEATVDAQFWSWATYKAQTVQDRDAWACMFRPGAVNPSLKQTRDGWTSIFGTQGASQTQVNYLLTLSRRHATESEQLFATGTGTVASPAVMGYEPPLRPTDIEQAWALG